MATEVKPTLPTRLNVGNSPMSAEFLYDGGPEWIAEVSYGRQTAELAAEIARRWNQHPDLLAKCERLEWAKWLLGMAAEYLPRNEAAMGADCKCTACQVWNYLKRKENEK